MTEDKKNQKQVKKPVSASDLVNRPPKVHVRDMSPNPGGPAVSMMPQGKKKAAARVAEGAGPKKKKPVPKKRTRADADTVPKKKKKKKKKATKAAAPSANEEASRAHLEKVVYPDEGKVFRFVGQKGVNNRKQKAQKRKFFVGLIGGAALFLGIGGYKVVTKPPPDKMIKVPETISSEKQLITFATAALAKRNELVNSFSFDGKIFDKGKNEILRYKLEFQKPSFMRVKTVEDGKTYIFDGALLSVQDGFERAIYNKNLLQVPEAERFLELNDIFGPFLVEGWRAPFLHESPLHLKGQEIGVLPLPYRGDGWEVTTPVLDEQLVAMKYTFRKGTADFLFREDLSSKGRALTSVWVNEEHREGKLEFAFPKKWERRDEFNSVTHEVELSNITINQEIPVGNFDSSTPTGFTVIAGPEGGFKEAADPAKVKL